MIINYLKIAVRSMLRNKLYSLLNLLGLALGLSCFILIYLWVFDELTTDQFHSKKDRIHTIIAQIDYEGNSSYWSHTPSPLAKVINEEVSGVDLAVRSTEKRELLFIKGLKKFNEEGIYVDSLFLKVFDFDLLYGNPEEVLKSKDNVVISEKLAVKIFGKKDVVGESVTIKEGDENSGYYVSGILKNVPSNSSMKFDFLISYSSYIENVDANWGNFNDITYLLLSENSLASNIESQLIPIKEKYTPNSTVIFKLLKTVDMYLRNDLTKGLSEAGRIIYVRIFSLVGIIILLIACINFMNLSTAKAGKRAKEVGIRKTVGSGKLSLVAQFLGESILISFLSLVTSLLVVHLVLPGFNILTQKELYLPYQNVTFLLLLIGLTTISGIFAGLYPSIILSSFEPAQVLKNAKDIKSGFGGFRKFLVIFQFSLSIMFISIAIIIDNQLDHFLNKDLGINKDGIIFFPSKGTKENFEVFRNEITSIEGVNSLCFSNFSPLGIHNSSASVYWPGKPDDLVSFFHILLTDHFFIETFNADLISGNNISMKLDTANMQFLVNESAVKAMDLDEPIGTKISVWGQYGVITGIMKDFHHQSLFGSIEPVIIYPVETSRTAYVSIKPDKLEKSINEIETVYKKHEGEYPFEYQFVTDDYKSQYKSILLIKRLTLIFSFLAIVISCLGLFGLSSYMVEQRKLETGIRKVFGASILQLAIKFNRKFIQIVAISFLISTPLAYYFCKSWLQEFAYRIEIQPYPFIFSGLLALVISTLTVSYHTYNTASQNPIESLKYE